MKICAFKNIVRRELPIYYRRLYTGIVVLDSGKGPKEHRIDFAIEHLPTGCKLVSFTFINRIDFPLDAVQEDIKRCIKSMDENNSLPE